MDEASDPPTGHPQAVSSQHRAASSARLCPHTRTPSPYVMLEMHAMTTRGRWSYTVTDGSGAGAARGLASSPNGTTATLNGGGREHGSLEHNSEHGTDGALARAEAAGGGSLSSRRRSPLLLVATSPWSSPCSGRSSTCTPRSACDPRGFSSPRARTWAEPWMMSLRRMANGPQVPQPGRECHGRVGSLRVSTA